MPRSGWLMGGWIGGLACLTACQAPANMGPAAPPPPGYRLLAADATRVVVVGGSEVAGWPARMAIPGATVTSLGREGATVAQVRDELVAGAIAANPTVAVVAVGGRDLLAGTTQADFKAALNTIAYRFRMAGIPLYIVDLPRLDRYPALASEDKALKHRVGDLHDALKCVVRDQDARFIRLTDWTRALRDNPGLVEADGLTPTADGQALLAEAIGKRIQLPKP